MKRIFAVLLSLACVAEARASDLSILTAFDTKTRNLDWYIVNDAVMGGRSNSRVERVDNQLVFSGVLNTKGDGFASIRSVPAQLDLGAVKSLVVKVRGGGRTYQMRLMSAKTRISYSANFTTEDAKWLEIELPVTSFLARSGLGGA